MNSNRPSTFHAPFRPGRIILGGRNAMQNNRQQQQSQQQLKDIVTYSPPKDISGQITLSSEKYKIKKRKSNKIGLSKVLGKPNTDNLHVHNLEFM